MLHEVGSVVGDVIVGNDGELFLAARHRSTLEIIDGTKRLAPSAIAAFRQNLSHRRTLAEQGGSRFLHLCAPEKHVVYESFYPRAIKYSYGRHMQEELPGSFLYPVDYLRSLMPHPSYRKVDTHWSILGRAAIAVLIAEKCFNDIDSEKELSKLKRYITQSKTEVSGDLGSKLRPEQKELADRFAPNWDLDRYNNKLSNGNDGYFEVIVSKNPLASGSLLIFGDSYMQQTLIMLSYFFKVIAFCRTGYFHEEIFSSMKPNFVVTENAERYFSDVYLDSKAPPFLLMPYLKGRTVDISPEAAMMFTSVLKNEIL